MRKIFLPLIFCLTMFFSSASAQDIYGSSKDGYDYYVMTETISKREFTRDFDGKNYPVTEITTKVKQLRGGKLIKVQNWKFVSINHRTWQYSVDDTERGSFSSIKTLYAQEIFTAMTPYI